jgi:predicted AAA+ superfamily ATPase
MKIYQLVGTWAFDEKFIGKRMVFLAGPRQIGKTTLSRLKLKELKQEKNYYNWDTISVRQNFTKNPYFFLENISEPILESYLQERSFPKYWIIFDEFHKHPKWKKLLKGYYDELGHFVRFVVCGSARLDLFRQTGESLLGRYFLFRMFPLSPNDVVLGKAFDFRKIWKPGSALSFSSLTPEWKEAVKQLYEISGFPEPFLQGKQSFYLRWKESYLNLLTTEEIRDLSRISDILRLQQLVFLLPERVGSPLSLNNLSQILQTSYNTVKIWLQTLEKVYLIFFLPPYSERLSRSIKKERKCYFWDWGILKDSGKRFENFLAVELMRTVSAWNEWGIGSFSLYYVRTREGKEVDFLILKDGSPFMLIEAKNSELKPDSSLLYFYERLKPQFAFQVVLEKEILKQVRPSVFVIDIFHFLKLLV